MLKKCMPNEKKCKVFIVCYCYNSIHSTIPSQFHFGVNLQYF